ncbi:MAG: phosphoribosylformylglycinamidine synthase subunit PurS, partial [Methanobrevibacter sp.]|nr:phosphoribosylformylglycinamidine synthase subunit PurS [Methanobrevibacter sp.]
MMYDIEVKVSLKPGMLNPEATTIQRSLALLGYEVKGTKTKEI